MMGVVNSVHASTTHHRIDKGEVPMVHTKTRLSAEQANMGETKAWQPTGKLTKDINTNSNNRWLQAERTDVMIHDEQVVGRHSIQSTPIL